MKTKDNPPTLTYALLAALVAVGLGVGIVRLINGMGPTTALSDSYPWGLWIIYDVFFVPFSAGAFMILAVAHIYNRREYHAIARPVVLAGFLGEIMVVAVLVMDLGRWHQFYNVLFPWFWNVRSFMFQVSICLTIYLGVMILEVAPAILERLNLQKPLRYIRPLTVLIAGVGIVLSSLHQSSLGSLFLLMPYKLNALWWTPLLPLLFFTSAAFSGLAMAIFVALASFRIFRRPLKIRLLAELARVAAAIMGIYLVLKVGDLLLNGEFGLLSSSGPLGALFVAELVIGVVVPLVLFGIPKYRNSSRGLFWGSASVLVGVLLNRSSVALLAEAAPAGTSYVPHWMELTIAIAAVAAGVLLFGLAVRLLPILPRYPLRDEHPEPIGWSRQATGLMASVLVVLTPLVVLTVQPLARADASQNGDGATPAAESTPAVENCRFCHVDATALTQAGAKQDDLSWLVIELQDRSTPHGRLDCVTCHQGNGASDDMETVHTKVVADPSTDGAQICLACHPDLPEEFPQDRLRTPHDEVTHGEAVDVYCSDCHGGVGHGFDPVGGGVICPMTVCIGCHQARKLDSELTDCDACHIGPHEPPPAMQCTACHLSTETWQSVQVDGHALDLSGKHGEAECSACHQQANVSAECTACHQPPAGHQAEACQVCHTPTGWAESAVLRTSGAPAMAHELDQRWECALCHDPAGRIRPTPTSHADYRTEYCLFCHATE